MALYYPYCVGDTLCNQITTPLVYDESLSIAQQIAAIMGRLSEIDTAYLPLDQFQEFLNQLNAEQAAQTSELEDYTDTSVSNLRTELIKLINGLQIGMLIWDVTQGAFDDNVQAMRDLFNDVTVHAITVDTLANLEGLTVDGLANSGLNVRGLAVFSGYLEGADFVPEGITYSEAPQPLNGKITCEVLAAGEVKDGYFVEGGA